MSTGLASQASTPGGQSILAAGFSMLSGQLSPLDLKSTRSSNNVAPPERLPRVVPPPPSVRPRSPAHLLTEMHETSGLTWDQIARYFGVSRRAVHLWVSGGRMSASNEELLAHLVRAVEAVQHLPASDRRQALLRSDKGLNIVDAERARRSSRMTDINRSPEIGVADDQV